MNVAIHNTKSLDSKFETLFCSSKERQKKLFYLAFLKNKLIAIGPCYNMIPGPLDYLSWFPHTHMSLNTTTSD